MTNYQGVERPKVLVLAMSGIGNLLMQTPLIKKLKDTNSTAEISVMLAPRGTKDVLLHNHNIKNVFVGYPKPSLKQRVRMIKTIQQGKFDIGIVAYPGQLITSSSLLSFGMIPTRIGHKYNYHFLKNSGLFLTKSFALQQTHDVQQNLNLLQGLGIDADPTNTEYDFPLTSAEQKETEYFLTQNNIDKTSLIGLHPGTNPDMAYKRWPVERWAQLADQLADQFKAKILIFGSADEDHLKTEIAKNMRHEPFNVTLSLRGTTALMSKCSFFVSNDSGLMHVAVSQKVPTFGLFGPTDENRTAPWGKYGHVIRAENTKPTYDVTKLREIKKLKTADETLLALNTETVFNQIVNSIPPLSDSANKASS